MNEGAGEVGAYNASRTIIWKAMFTPLDICIRLSSAINYSVRSKFTGRTTWSSVHDSREEEAGMCVMVADSAPTALCKVRIHCRRIRDSEETLLTEVHIEMDLENNHELDLEKFPLEHAMKEYWNLYPVVTLGTRYNIEYSKERGPELKTTKVMNVWLRALSAEFSISELEQLDFEGTGDDIADYVEAMIAIYFVAKQITSSMRSSQDEPSDLRDG
jgi:hypothetical protein